MALLVLLEGNRGGRRHVPAVALIAGIAGDIAPGHVDHAGAFLYPRACVRERPAPRRFVFRRNLVLDATCLLIALWTRAAAAGPSLRARLAGAGESVRTQIVGVARLRFERNRAATAAVGEATEGAGWRAADREATAAGGNEL